jgi:hypothetical protein
VRSPVILRLEPSSSPTAVLDSHVPRPSYVFTPLAVVSRLLISKSDASISSLIDQVKFLCTGFGLRCFQNEKVEDKGMFTSMYLNAAQPPETMIVAMRENMTYHHQEGSWPSVWRMSTFMPKRDWEDQ